jgi:hypothetical protein
MYAKTKEGIRIELMKPTSLLHISSPKNRQLLVS